MIVKHCGRGRVSALPAVRQDPVPELRVLAAARSSGAKSFVKQPHGIEGGPADNHIAASADAPHWRRLPTRSANEFRAVGAWFIPLMKSAERMFKGELGFGSQFGWENQATCGRYRW